jgi:hypothetical protein
MVSDLIYDVGMHDGRDTAHYLRCGYRVVAVEANPELVAAAEKRFGDVIAAGRLTIVPKAVAAYTRGLEALGRLPATPETARIGIDLRLALRAPLWRQGQLERLREIFGRYVSPDESAIEREFTLTGPEPRPDPRHGNSRKPPLATPAIGAS